MIHFGGIVNNKEYEMKSILVMSFVSLALALSSSAWAVCYKSNIGGGMLCCTADHSSCHIQ